jgi:hypothetical protein
VYTYLLRAKWSTGWQIDQESDGPTVKVVGNFGVGKQSLHLLVMLLLLVWSCRASLGFFFFFCSLCFCRTCSGRLSQQPPSGQESLPRHCACAKHHTIHHTPHHIMVPWYVPMVHVYVQTYMMMMMMIDMLMVDMLAWWLCCSLAVCGGSRRTNSCYTFIKR